MSFVPFELGSPRWMIAEVVIPYLIEQMHERSSRVHARSIASAVVKTWSIMSNQHRQELTTAVADVLGEAEKLHFARFIRRRGTLEWDIVENPLNLGTDKRTREFKRLLKAQKSLISDLRQGVKPAKQLELPVDGGSEAAEC